jgi:hypothetical protein
LSCNARSTLDAFIPEVWDGFAREGADEDEGNDANPDEGHHSSCCVPPAPVDTNSEVLKE